MPDLLPSSVQRAAPGGDSTSPEAAPTLDTVSETAPADLENPADHARRPVLRRSGQLGALGLVSLVLAACEKPFRRRPGGAGSGEGSSADPTAGGESPGTAAPSDGGAASPGNDAAPADGGDDAPAAGSDSGTEGPAPGNDGSPAAPAEGAPPANADLPVDMADDPSAPKPAPEESPAQDGTPGSPAQMESPEAYEEVPGSPSLEAETELSPGLLLRTTPEWHLARRASLAPTADLVQEIAAVGIEGWIDQQLDPDSIDDSRADDFIAAHFPMSTRTAAEARDALGEVFFRSAPEVRNAIIYRTRLTNRHLRDSVTELLGDILYVPIFGKAEVYASEHDTLLRSQTFGTYRDLLHGALTSPPLLLELDNAVNTAKSPNENLGRELLELYSVGRENYTEDDVAACTVLLTGHGEDWESRSYVYRPENHATGPVSVVGFSDANADASKGPELLERFVAHLASHEGTARMLATRFATRFITDSPSDQLVADLAKAYLDADTSIAALTRATLTHPEFMDSVGKKWRRPLEYIMTIARAAHVEQINPRMVSGEQSTYAHGMYGWNVELASHGPRNWPAVDGYPDTAQHWLSTNGLKTLWNGAQAAVVGDAEESGETRWSEVLRIQAGADAMETARRITTHLTGYTWSEEHLELVADMLLGDTKSLADTPQIPADMSAETLEYLVRHAVRLTFSSPYGFLR